MKVKSLKHVSPPPILLGSRVQLLVAPFVMFYVLLVLFMNWNISMLGFGGLYGVCIYLTRQDLFLIEGVPALLRLSSKKQNKRERYYGV